MLEIMTYLLVLCNIVVYSMIIYRAFKAHQKRYTERRNDYYNAIREHYAQGTCALCHGAHTAADHVRYPQSDLESRYENIC